MAIYRGPGGANDGIPSSSSTEFPGDVNVAGNLHVNGDITSDGNINGVHTGDGSGLTGVLTELPTLLELGIPNHDKITVDELGNVTVASDITVDGVLYGDGSGLTNLPIPELPDVYNKSEIDAQQNVQDNAIANNTIAIQANTDAIANIPTPVDTYTKAEIDDQQNAQDVEIAKKANTDNTYTKTQTDTLLDSKANVGDSYLKTETYSSVETDSKLFEKADKATTYTKDEIDSLLESSSGAIVANYTNKHASSVARDPGAGNLYLSNGITFSTDYNDVIAIYISDTDGDGNVRDFDEVKENDKVTLSSENGSGEYTIVTISDVGGYRELVVSTESSNGTIANDSAVSIVLDVASNGGSGGGKTVAFRGELSANQNVTSATWTKVNLDTASIDTDNALVDGKFKPSVAGYYQVNASVDQACSTPSTLTNVGISKNGTRVTYGSQIRTSEGSYTAVASDVIYLNGTTDYLDLYGLVTSTGSCLIYRGKETTYLSAVLVSGGSASGGIEEAPADGKQYARKDEAWTEVTGGGSTPTPEALVWEDKKAERDFDTEYTNTNEVPLYVQLYVQAPDTEGFYTQFYIDGEHLGSSGGDGAIGRDLYNNPLYIVPAGSTYELRQVGTNVLKLWHEARMPLAISVGGASGGGEAQPPVAFGMYLADTQSNITAGVETTVPLDTVELDTDNGAQSDGTYIVQKEGIYNLSYQGFVTVPNNNGYDCKTVIKINGLTKSQSKLRLNGTTKGINVHSGGSSITVSLKKDDVISLATDAVGDGTYSVNGTGIGSYNTALSGHMVSSITEGEVKEKEAVVASACNDSVELTIPHDTWTVVPFPTIRADANGYFDTTLSRFNPKTEGWYYIDSNIYFKDMVSAGFAVLTIHLNSQMIFSGDQSTFTAGSSNSCGVSGMVYMNGVDDFVEIRTLQTSGSSVDLFNIAPYQTFNAHLITGQSSGGSGTGTTTATVDTAIGMVAPFAMDSVPTGWLHCDGSEVSRTTYSLLYSKVGDLYGAGDGSTTFNLPDLQDEFIRGSSDTLPVGNKQDDEFKSHKHNIPGSLGGDPSGYYNLIKNTQPGTQGTNNSTGELGGSETRPRNVAMLYCINATAEPSSGGGEVVEKEAVVFRGELSAEQTVLNSAFTKVNIDTATIDTDNALVDGKFQPSVAGYYQVNGSVGQSCSPSSVRTDVAIYKNGTRHTYGTAILAEGSYLSNASDIIYFNGTTDYIELWGKVKGSGTTAFTNITEQTYLSAHLITGQSTGGSSGGASIDYEEGEYDAELTIGGTVNATAKATYSRIGNQVTLHIPTLNVTGKTGTGEVRISAPFIANDNSSTGVVRFGGFGNLGTSTTIAPFLITGENSIALQTSNADGYVLDKIKDQHCNNNFVIHALDITYKTSGFSSSGGGSNGGETTDILPVILSGAVNTDGTVKEGTGFTSSRISIGKYQITFDTPRDSVDYVVLANARTTLMKASPASGDVTESSFIVYTCSDMDGTFADTHFNFVVTGTKTISVGGDYTPEKMVWEDKLADRELNTVYTNTNDVPLYVQLSTLSNVGSDTDKVRFNIDGKRQGEVGTGSNPSLVGNLMNNPLYIVPSGSTYEAKAVTAVISEWKEAKMPVAVGTGGKTVAFRANMTTTGVTLDGGVYKVVPFNTTEFDTENAFDSASHSYVVKESGLYNFTTYVQTIAPGAYHAGLFVNGIATAYGSNVGSPSLGTNDSYILDLKVGDKVDYRLLGDTGLVLTTSPSTCYFSGFKVSGGTASGDSPWTQQGNDLVYLSPNTDSGVFINSQEPKNINIVGYNGTEANDLWLRSGGAPNSGLGIKPDGSIYVSPDGYVSEPFDGFESQQVSHNEIAYTTWAQSGGIKAHFGVDTSKGISGTFSNHDFVIRTNNQDRIKVLNDGRTYMYGVNDSSAPATPNVVIGGDGQMFKSTTAMYSAEEVDKKLAIKDKLIEKLSARLDELEQKFNNGGGK